MQVHFLPFLVAKSVLGYCYKIFRQMIVVLGNRNTLTIGEEAPIRRSVQMFTGLQCMQNSNLRLERASVGVRLILVTRQV